MSSINMKIVLQEAKVPPVTEFKTNVTNGQVPLSVQFTDLSENATARFWDFGEGINSKHDLNATLSYIY